MRTCQKCRVRKPDYEFPRKKYGKMGIQVICKKCKEERQKKKLEHLSELERKRLIFFNKRKSQKVKDPVYRVFTLNTFHYKKINEHVKKFGYPTKAAFYRDAAAHQLRTEETFFDSKQTRPDIIQRGATFSKFTLDKILCSTALLNYSNFSDFMRTAIKNKIKWECNNGNQQ